MMARKGYFIPMPCILCTRCGAQAEQTASTMKTFDQQGFVTIESSYKCPDCDQIFSASRKEILYALCTKEDETDEQLPGQLRL